MKKIAAILLLAIFVFNLFGYKIWLAYLENKANQSLEMAMDNNQYRQEELVSIKKALNLPYYNNTKEFSRMDGEVEVNGMYYKYVKCRIYNDSLELLCLPNAQKTQLTHAKEDFFKLTADIQKKSTEKNKSNPVNPLKKMLSEFVSGDTNGYYAVKTITALPYPNHHNANLGMVHKTAVEQPPEIVRSIS